MGHEVIIYGRIEGAAWRSGDDFRRLQERNAEVLAALPEEDEWPALVRGMFGVPAPWPRGTYHSQVIHFGASFKDEVDDQECWDEWLGKFEALLRNLYWYSATVHLETEFEPHRMYRWLPTADAVGRMVSESPQCVQEWTRSDVLVEE